MKDPLNNEGASGGTLLMIVIVIVLLLATTVLVFGQAYYVPAMPHVMLLPFLTGGALLGLHKGGPKRRLY